MNFGAAAEAAATVLLRGVERVLPPRVLHAMLWPAAALAAAGRLVRPGRRRAFRRLPWPTTFRGLWRDRTRLEEVRLMGFWRDRFRSPGWRTRCRVEGLERLPPARPAILATLHYASLDVLVSVLRAHGCRACVMVRDRYLGKRPRFRARLDRLEDEANGLLGVPRLIPATALWNAHDHLRSGGLLVLAVDGRAGPRAVVRSGALEATLGRGVLRLARIADADVFPCLAHAGAGLSCTVRVGAALPRELVEKRERHAEAYSTLLAALLDGVREAPGQCRSALLTALGGAGGSSTPERDRPYRPRILSTMPFAAGHSFSPQQLPEARRRRRRTTR